MRRSKRTLECMTLMRLTCWAPRGLPTAIALVLVTVGAQVPAWGQGNPPAAEHVGHVYLAQLMVRHPLYPDLVRLERAIQSLQTPEPEMVLETFTAGARIEGEYIAGPVISRWAVERLVARRDEIVTGLSTVLDPTLASLPEDLASELQWRRDQIQRAARLELLTARADSSRELAEASVRLYRENQERLTSLGEELEGAGENPEDVRAELEEHLAQMRAEHEERLDRLEHTVAQRTQAAIAQSERSAWRRARTRLRRPTGGISESLREGMIETLQSFPFPDWLSDVSLQIPAPQLPTGDVARDAVGTVDSARQCNRERLAAELVRRRAVITENIRNATRLGAERIARKHGVRLQFSPVGDAQGPDMTEEIGEALSALWGAGSR
ncbi:MAG: hypothetical protein HPY44_07375 [Armatimonadetes bacterium]|nr:hypothetical protein [Armatimonadota bacterium]